MAHRLRPTTPMSTVSTDLERPAPLQPAALNHLELHNAVFADDFVREASALRQELLYFPTWKPMRPGYNKQETLQTGITTGHIEGRYPELTHCHRYHRFLTENAGRLAEALDVHPRGEITVSMLAMAYGEGGRLRLHTDSIDQRVMASILYLTDPDDGPWTRSDGGQLVLTDLEGTEEELSPAFNRFAALKVSDSSWHEVRRMKRRNSWPSARLCIVGFFSDHLSAV